MFGRKSALWLAAAAISVLACLAPASASALTGPNACNGAIELCDRPLDEVVLPGTHNSMSNEEYGWIIPNQITSIPAQLNQGIRAFLIDTHYGKPGTSPGEIVNWNSGADGNPHQMGAATYLCHEQCAWGASPLAEELAKITDFLSAHPREVLTFVVQNGIHPEDFAAAVTASGLIDYVYTGSTASYPTLGEMISSNQRVVMLSEGSTSPVTWFHNGYAGALQETPYDFRSDEEETALTTQQAIAQLADAANLNSSCRPFRGGTNGALFLMNHWVNGLFDTGTTGNVFSPDPAVSAVLNTREVLVNRARACQERRGILPSIIAVDLFIETDGLLAATDELNGVAPDPDPDPDPEPKGMIIRVKAPKKVQVRAGKTAVFKLTVTNAGDKAGPAKICARVPARLARKPKCLTRNVKPGAKVTLKIKVRTKPKAKGKAKVTFTATAAGKTARAGTTLIVKPRKRR